MFIFSLFLYSLYLTTVESQYSPSTRWGAASMVKDNVLYVHGGKVPSNQASYNSAPVTNELFSLDLSNSFQASQPPWSFLSGSANSSTSQGPAVAFHTLSAVSSTLALCFGGDGGPSMPLSTLADSAWTLALSSSISASWSPQLKDWASEPVRRVYHAASYDVSIGSVWITGGMKVDGSAVLSDAFTFTSTPSFQPISSASVQLPQIYGHKSFRLPTGELIIIGGAAQGNLSPLSTIYLYNSSTTSPSWSVINATGTSPSPRRNFAGTMINNGKILIHGGTSSIGDAPDQLLSDGFILDTSQQPMTWSEVPNLSSLGPRTDHLIASSGNQVLFAFGWGSGGAVNNSLSIFNADTSNFVENWTATSSPSPSGTAPGTASPTRPPPTGTFPHPSVTASGPNSSGSSGANPGNTNGGLSQHSTAIALAAVFGVLALVAAVGALTYTSIRRREQRRGGAFQLLMDNKGGDGHNIQASGPVEASRPERVHMADSSSDCWSFIPAFFGKRKSHTRDRVDMLAGEEDSQMFDPYDYPTDYASHGYQPRPRPRRDASGNSFGSSISNWYGLATRRNWGDFVSHSVSALRLVGGASYGEQSTRSGPLPLDPFSDDMAMRGQYNPVVGGDVDAEDAATPVPVPEHSRPPSLSVITPASDDIYPLPTAQLLPGLSETHSKSTTSTIRAISPTRQTQALHDSSDSSSSQLGLPASTSAGVKRSDSWWNRFSLSSLNPTSPVRSPRASMAEPSSIAFRDPNPPPRLLPIKEGSQSSPDTAGTAGTAELASGRRSRSSHRTIDSEAIERMAGNMDVIQRIESNSSRQTESSVDDSENPPTLVSPPHANSHPIAANDQSPETRPRSQSVADRVLTWETRVNPDSTDRPRRRSHNYGLAPRGSLFIANPDHNKQSS